MLGTCTLTISTGVFYTSNNLDEKLFKFFLYEVIISLNGFNSIYLIILSTFYYISFYISPASVIEFCNDIN